MEIYDAVHIRMCCFVSADTAFLRTNLSVETCMRRGLGLRRI